MSRRTASKRSPLTATGVEKLGVALESLVEAAGLESRVGFDPVAFPRRYTDPRDVEVSGLIAAALAYGRVDLFKPKIESILMGLGPRPAEAVQALTIAQAKRLLEGFVYRFNLATDVAVLLFGVGRALGRHGSLEALFLAHWKGGETGLHPALGGFLAELREVPMEPLRAALGPERGLQHMLPAPLGPGASKRMLMYLRWMVRGPDAVDLGIWKQVPASALLLPLDTHTGRMAQHLGLTSRTDLSWKTAEEVTTSLRRIDPVDPVRFDFALCHHGMSGACPASPQPEHCAPCALRPVCRTGPQVLRQGRVRTD